MIRIAFSGDVFLGQQHWTYKRGILSQIDGGADILSKNLIEKLSNSNYFIGNLETPILDLKPDDPLEFCFASSREILKRFLANIPSPILSVANNHILDHGIAGYQQTLKILNELNVIVIGAKTSFSNDPFMYVEDPSGVTIAVGSFCDFGTGLKENEVIWSLDRELIVNAIKNAKKSSQVIVLYLHWGREFLSRPSSEQVRAMMQFNEAGADLIVGHHPHICHSVYSTGKSVFASSLGNFIFDQYESKATRKGNLLLVDCEHQNFVAEVLDIDIPRKLPVKITNTRKVPTTNRLAIKRYPENVHRFLASMMTQVFRILARIDLVLHIYPNTGEKLRCMFHWSSRRNRL